MANAALGPGEQLQVALSPARPLAAADGGVSAAAVCNRYNRTQVCQSVTFRVNVLRNRRPVGYLTGHITQAIVFNTKSRSFRENFALKTTGVHGQAGGVRETLAVSCGGGCKARSGVPAGRVLHTGATIKGKITYADGVRPGKVHSTASRYTLTFTKPGYTPGAVSWTSIGYRCDDTIKTQRPGCVIPRYAPTMTAMRKLPHIAANIRRIQTRGPGHYGRPGSGHPLHRLTDKKQQNDNRRAVCGRKVVGPPPRPGVSCDEYPFASSREGGTKLGKKDRGTAWVPSSEQNKQAGYITSSHNAQRVLNGDAFYVSV
ncbi:NucA/NucB deoxyribonuclease domain-containing protein [Actinomadura geliboluensis]|uniref:Deoxyribonuclease NucA/NucB domain-containing protein n=1 Tax=Actinomadura geliboluensis TaxID=882440 RepID=A0A5S4H5Q2_9ACTN|nr:NucA/NucB deoxyribonuclease domain-containing protein [Actinomadura geliboluensis]TMR40555.1 hypothetical protein ETD96_10230 [Actinomadura geliboluensis]